jgi:hypothetical protein
MAVQPAIEGLAGIDMDAPSDKLILSPAFPVTWDSVEVNNIRMGSSYYSMKMRRENERQLWKISNTSHPAKETHLRFNLTLPLGAKVHRVLVNGNEYEAELVENKLGLNLELSQAKNRNLLEIEILSSAGICVLPEVIDPMPGDRSGSHRIITESLAKKEYTLVLNGKSGSDASFRIYCPGGFTNLPDSCKLLKREGNVSFFFYHFPEADSRYVTVPLKFKRN